MESKSIKVAVISDLHIGDMAKGKDFSPEKTENASVENYLQEFSDFVDREKLSADYLLVTGDISNKAKDSEFELASNLIEKIAQALNVNRKHIFFCPGNHDVNWPAIKSQREAGASDDLVLKAKYLNLLKPGLIFSDNQAHGAGRFDDAPYFVIWKLGDINVFSLNSAIYDEPDKKPHCGEIKSEQLTVLESLLDAHIDKSKLNIFILHHHPKQYHDRTFQEGDKSGMINADGLLHLLSKKEIDFIVHGHKHIPRFDMEINSDGHPLWILCSGSFSSRLDDRYFGGVGNFFHIIDFHSRCQENGWSRGIVKSWTHLLGHKWLESGTIDFDSSNQFGAYVSPQKLRNLLESTLEGLFKDKSFIEWSDLIATNESIQYYPNNLLRSNLAAVAQKMKLLQRYSGQQQAFESLILIRERSA
ncbi:metallophosphoesterase family protein [Stutzerimonas stutzeri]|uniref:metallophosphoesterase family protein n=1 Tax=Stutzerimonas stutzeri TaxID=316 RepID=UPI000F7B34F4|nr:metallophosphoesterase [Stutzerimonas stutzeri]RSH69227.1 metallophosphoesterase [Stutzerimonas stutzeri]